MTDVRAPEADPFESAPEQDDPGRPAPGRPAGTFGLGEWLTWAWRQLTSMRIALILLFLLALASVPGSMLPQQGNDPAGVAFLGVDVRDTTASALAFARDFGITYPSVSDSGSVITLDFTAVVPIAGTPTTLVIDRTGHIAGAVFGTATYQVLTDILARVTGKTAG